MDCFFYTPICKFQYHIEIVFVDSYVYQKLIHVFFVISEFLLCLLDQLIQLLWFFG